MSAPPLHSVSGYCDLNVPIALNCFDRTTGQMEGSGKPQVQQMQQRLLRAFRLGYTTVAVNFTINQDELTTKGKAKHQQQSKKAKKSEAEGSDDKLMTDFPTAPNTTELLLWLRERCPEARSPSLLTRLTLVVNNNNFLPVVNNSSTVSGYDIIAVSPTNTAALVNMLKTGFRFDVVSFPADRTKDVKWSRKLYTECLERHAALELLYSPCIADSTHRRRMIALGHNYHSVGRARGIILSSGAEEVVQFRGPHDVANLGFLFGLTECGGKKAVSEAPLEVARTAAGRKLGPYRVEAVEVSEVPKKDRWKLSEATKRKLEEDDEDEEEGTSSEEEEEEDLNVFADVMM